MSKNLQSPTKLTEFAPIQTDERPSSVGQIITNFFRFATKQESPPKAVEAVPNWALESTGEPPADYQLDAGEGRSLPNVLKRIRNLLALKSQDYNERNLKQYWMKDAVSRECYECGEKFTTFRRRHHCRVCGQIFCSQCCNPQHFACIGEPLRVCTYCARVVASYVEADAAAAEAEPGYLTERERRERAPLRAIYEEAGRPGVGVAVGRHHYRLRTYDGCFLGSELVDWMVGRRWAASRMVAAEMCEALLEGGFIECVAEPGSFVDGYALYKRGVGAAVEAAAAQQPYFEEVEPMWVQQIGQESSATDSDNESNSPHQLHSQLQSSNSYQLDLNVEANSAYLSLPSYSNCNIKSTQSFDTINQCDNKEIATVRTSEQRENVPVAGWHNTETLRDENAEKQTFHRLAAADADHSLHLLTHLLAAHALPPAWQPVLAALTADLTTALSPDKRHDAVSLDVRHYVQFKKLPGATRAHTRLVAGVVATKNVAHRAMPTAVEDPRILLLQCPIDYQRTAGRLMSLEPVLMQEGEYLRHVTARIAALQPNVVLVRRNVARLAQDLLRLSGVTLVHNVKQSVLERVARCTQADLVTVLDAPIGRPKLGTCRRFYLKRFELTTGEKTLMVFEGLPQAHLGASVLLRGGTRSELVRVERVARFYLFARYNWRLEMSYLMDAFAKPPILERLGFLDDSGEDSPVGERRCAREDGARVGVRMEAVEALTDPLHCYAEAGEGENGDGEVFRVDEQPLSNGFRKGLDDAVLCVSPYIRFSVPFLETDAGRRSKLRGFFPKDIYFSEQFGNQAKFKLVKEVDEEFVDNRSNQLKPLHEFQTTKLTTNVNSNEIQALLANFRACGGSYTNGKEENFSYNLSGELLNRSCNKENKQKNKNECYYNKLDVLEIQNHQRLSVLFCSFSHESNNAPAFCVNPWIVTMIYYGSNDIPLGCFLERYCFRPTYACPSAACATPMLKHIRRFVHHAGCVSVTLNSYASESTDDVIVMWSWCARCQSTSPVIPISADTWSLSFAKYLELKFYAGSYSRRGAPSCGHSLHHDHFQYFGYKNCVATFQYSPIDIWEVSLPDGVIEVRWEWGGGAEGAGRVGEEVRQVVQKGGEVYQVIGERLAAMGELEGVGGLKGGLGKEQGVFRGRVEELQLRLMASNGEQMEFDLHSYWQISDLLVRLKRTIAEAVETWNVTLGEAGRRRDLKKKERGSGTADLDSPNLNESRTFTDSDQSAHADGQGGSKFGENASVELSEDECELNGSISARSERVQGDGGELEVAETKKESDKMTVKTILSQLLPSTPTLAPISSPFSPQEHHLLPPGTSVPLIVYETEPSSIIAYALNSHDYKKSLDDQSTNRTPRFDPQTPSPNPKRRSHHHSSDAKLEPHPEPPPTAADPKQPPNEDAAKRAKNAHIEVQFQDANCNFFCRIYFAELFAKLRNSVLPIGEDGYVRSLSRSMQWNARGGKSGSHFAKTSDDRLILKEMSKSEVQLFAESAPNYFDYMIKCGSSGQPTLLGKIIGVYQIIYRTSGNVTLRTNLLVMENLFYRRKVTQKFDLKGSVRNRLVVPENQEGEIVLLDENLLKLTCDAPLYILPHSKAVLTAAIQNDTEFLSMQSVMDYSLLVGLDVENKELVLGIIDYIRTFTWDKKLETMVKKTGLLGGQGKQPTIVKPEDYQKRFIEAMHRYFLEVPDHWAGLEKGLEF